jgi:hypothetical protein
MGEITSRLKEVACFYGDSASAFARRVNVPQTTIAYMFLRDTEPTSKTLNKIITALSKDISALWIKTGYGEMINTEGNAYHSQEERPIPKEDETEVEKLSTIAREMALKMGDIANELRAIRLELSKLNNGRK